MFLDYPRMAAAVAAALGMPLSAERWPRGAAEATRAMEQARGADRGRAAAYLEALFRVAGVPADRMVAVRDCLTRLHQQRHLWSSLAADTHEALGRLRAAGIRLGVVSNSDGRVEEALEAADLLRYFDVVLDSALVGRGEARPRYLPCRARSARRRARTRPCSWVISTKWMWSGPGPPE